MNKMFLNIEAFMYTPGSRCLCPLTSPLSKNLVEMISSPTKEPNPRLSTDKGRENTDVMKITRRTASAPKGWAYSQIPES